MKLGYFIGIDVSKSSFHYCILHGNADVISGECVNQIAGVLEFIRFVRNHVEGNLDQVVFCMEHTGIYCTLLLSELHAAGAKISIESAYQIKRSLGLQRGKSDEVDARRIAEYACRFADKLNYWKPKRKVIEQLTHLTTMRARLVKVRTQLTVPVQEAKEFLDEPELYLLTEPTEKVLMSIEETINDIEQKIKQVLNSDTQLKSILKRLTSIPGIGVVTATELIIRTNEFRDFQNAKQLACHVGVAPFEHNSGTSIRGRTRVDHKAHKKLKTLLHLGAMAAINRQGEFRKYYDRKLAEGKNKMSVLNAVRNKLIHRVFAIVKNGTIYEENYQYKFA